MWDLVTYRHEFQVNFIFLSFDIHEILLETDQGMLMIKGDDLHVNRLTLEKGEVDIDGRIDSFTYSEAANHGAKGESLFNKLFR